VVRTQLKIAVPIPPIPMDRPKISPEAIAKFCGMKLCPRAMVMEFEEMIVIPATVKKIKAHVPLV